MIILRNTVYLLFATIIPILSCEAPSSDGDAWTSVKAQAAPINNLSSEFNTPYRQVLSTMGWEDGIYISRDGLDLYCTYVPGDLLSWTINSADPTAFDPYLRGPLFGMDLTTNPVGASSWAQADIMYSHRASTAVPFPSWTDSNISRSVFSEGAPQQLTAADNTPEKFIFTSNDKSPTYDTDIWCINSTSKNPSGPGAPLSVFTHTTATEDNPHMERIDSSTLVLMFDSDNYPSGLGSNDIWYSISTDNGTSWSTPANVSSVNTTGKEHQPHLFYDGSDWYLYFSADNSDGKLGIFRAKQTSTGNWNSWGTRELVVGAGNTAGVGEPSLTANGDLSFVVVYDKGDEDSFNRYDADPWFMAKK